MKPSKFVIYEGKIILGRVDYHKDLLPPNYDVTKIDGGGVFTYCRENKVIVLSGSSHDFGRFVIGNVGELEAHPTCVSNLDGIRFEVLDD